ncbi:DNA polymerase alpha/epsilon subunit B-domain-containing protein [Chytriomyces sp. MP71]|nr:DNA polymerase alpha/epsilon subunit B-domain-containing protein [Chytriomyces sp. MP71]
MRGSGNSNNPTQQLPPTSHPSSSSFTQPLRANYPAPQQTPFKSTPLAQRVTLNHPTGPPSSSPAHPSSSTPLAPVRTNPAVAGSKTPSAGVHKPSAGSPAAPPFAERRDKGKIEQTYGAHVPRALHAAAGLDALAREAAAAKEMKGCEISLAPGQQMDGYRYMFDRLTEKGDLVDARIEELTLVMDKWIYNEIVSKTMPDAMEEDVPADMSPSRDGEVNFKALSNPTLPRQERFYTAGRIVIDPTPTYGDPTAKLNTDTIMLETCRALGGGQRVSLHLTQPALDAGLALFPGMILGLAGVNPSGRSLAVETVYPLPRVPFATTRAARLLEMYPAASTTNPARAVNLLAAAGPYSVPLRGGGDGSDALSYEPLAALAETVERECPDVVLLLGPFVDEAACAAGKGLSVLPERVFRDCVAPLVRRMTRAAPWTRVVLVPSTRGLESEWVAYPQPPLGSVAAGEGEEAKVQRWRELGLKEMVAAGKVLLVPNPVQLSVNEVVIAVSCVDSLMHVAGQEVYFAPKVSSMETPDRMTRHFSHHLTQRHMYPLAHAPAHTNDPGAGLFALDSTRAQSGAITLQATPDVFITPSLLAGNVKNVDGALCVNPGMLVKGRGGVAGTFARICVHPLDVEELRGMVGATSNGGSGGDVIGAGMKRKEGGEDGTLVEGDESGIVLEHSVASRCRVEIQKI